MHVAVKIALLLPALLLSRSFGAEHQPAASPSPAEPAYTTNGELRFPDNYRTWIFLSSGFDMSYNPATTQDGATRHAFDNVFVDPTAYQQFLRTGTWPDKTMLVLEIRGAEGKGSINQSGHFQSTVTAVEVHVRDSSRFENHWGFFGFENNQTAAKRIPTTASCYSCHADHAAVDTTFVQFYPTLFPIAQNKKTLSPAFLNDPQTSTHAK